MHTFYCLLQYIKYLGHIITDDGKDDKTYLMFVVSYMQVQFSFMKKSYVHWKRKIKLFVTYCSQFYCAHLQTYNISDEKYNKVLVAYNNVLRFLLCLPRHCSASHMFVRIMLSNQICDDLLNLKLEVGIRPRPCSASHTLVCIMLL